MKYLLMFLYVILYPLFIGVAVVFSAIMIASFFQYLGIWL